MLGSMSIYEEFWGAIPEDYDSTMFCLNCGDFLPVDEPYIERWDGEVLCADCIETKTHEFILEFIGYDNIFDVIEKMGKLEYVS